MRTGLINTGGKASLLRGDRLLPLGGATAAPPAPVAPTNVTPPIIVSDGINGPSGPAVRNDHLSVNSDGDWSGDPTIEFTYEWFSDGSDLGQSGSSYTAQAGDVGHTITCVVTATNGVGSTPATSNGIAVNP